MRFSPFEARMFSAAASALLDRVVVEPEVEPFLFELGEKAPKHVSWGLRGILLLAWASPMVTGQTRRPFTSVSHEERIALWSWALDHEAYPIRQLALTAKAMVCLCLLDEDQSQKGAP